MPKKPRIIDASTLRTPIFAIENGFFQDQHGYRQASRAKPQPSPTIHPDKLQRTHYVGPPPGDQKSKRM